MVGLLEIVIRVDFWKHVLQQTKSPFRRGGKGLYDEMMFFLVVARVQYDAYQSGYVADVNCSVAVDIGFGRLIC